MNKELFCHFCMQSPECRYYRLTQTKPIRVATFMQGNDHIVCELCIRAIKALPFGLLDAPRMPTESTVPDESDFGDFGETTNEEDLPF